MARRRVMGLIAGVACATALGGMRPQAGASQAPTPLPKPIAILDRFGRDLQKSGITLVDWEGHIANPAVRLTVEIGPHVNLPARVVLRANGSRLMFDLFSEVGPGGPTKTLLFSGPARRAQFLMAVFPDRDAVDETYELSAVLTTGVGETRTESVPVRVLDQDRDRPCEHMIAWDFSQDATGFFADAGHRRIVQQAASDWAYYLADQGFDPVPTGGARAWICEATTFERGWVATNTTPYTGFLLFAQGIRGPERRSGGRASDVGEFQSRAGRAVGLRRSGTIIAEVTGNWNGLGWSLKDDDESWCVSSNHAREQHDLYSVMRHEIGHALLYHRPHSGFGKLIRHGRLRDREIEQYLGGAPEISAVEHMIRTVDPVSRVGAFGNEYGGDMPRKRWLLTKLDLLVLRAAGYRLRDTSPLAQLVLAVPSEVRARVGDEVAASCEAGGGIPAYHFRVAVGRLPEGLTLDAESGRLSGRPARAGRYRLVIEVADQDPSDRVVRKAMTIVVADR